MRLLNILKNLVRKQYYSGTLTTTYTSNSYVDQSSFNRITFQKCGGIVVVCINLSVSNMGTSSAFTKIGSVDWNGHPPMTGTYLTIPFQSNGSGTLLLQILSNGNIEIYNNTSTTMSGFCRAQVPIALKP